MNCVCGTAVHKDGENKEEEDREEGKREKESAH